MEFIRRHKTEILLGLGIILFYLVSRLLNIMHLPLFTDEAIYVRWSQIAKQDASWRFISLTDGRQPMYVWWAMILMRLIKDPLLAGRCVSVLTGFISTIGMFFLGRELFKNKWIGFISAALYAVSPFALVYDRMALYDSMVAMFAIWGLYIEVLLVRRLRTNIAFIAGLVVGGGMLTKSNAFFNVYFLPFTLLLFDLHPEGRVRRFIRWVLLAGLVTILSYLYYSILRLSPYFGIIAEKNYTFIYSFHDWLQHPFTFFVGNFHGMFFWMITYIGWLGFALAIMSLFVIRKFWKEKFLLIVWCGLPFLALAIDGKVLYPRYIFPMVIFLFPLIACSLYALWVQVKRRSIALALMVLLLASYLYVDRFIIFDFAHAPIPSSDLTQYINGWSAGSGIKEIDAFLGHLAQSQKIYAATEGTYGLMPEAVEISLANNPQVTIKGYWPITATLPNEIKTASHSMPTYVIFYEPCEECTNINQPPAGWHAKFIAKYQQGISTWYTSLYQIIPE